MVASESVHFGKTVLAFDPAVVDKPELLDQEVRLVMSRKELAVAEFLVIATPWTGFKDFLGLGIPSVEIY